MEIERRITAPEGCEIEKVKIVDGVAVVTFKPQERKLPKSWEEFSEMYPIKDGEYYVEDNCNIIKRQAVGEARLDKDKNLLPDYATAEAILALCQLIQLRNAYNGEWVPNLDGSEHIYYIVIDCLKDIRKDVYTETPRSYLYFKNKELCDEFLRNFRPLIEKLKPLYGIKKGGEE